MFGKIISMKVFVKLSLALFLASALLAPEAGRGKDAPSGAPTADHPDAYKGMSQSEIDRLKVEELVILQKPARVEGRQMITAAVIFNQDIDTVWELMTQGWRQSEYLPRLKESKLVKKTDTGDILEMHVEVMNVKIDYQIVGVRDKAHYHSHWKLDPSFPNDMKEVTGFWKFYWLDEHRTLARYGTWVEPAIWLPDPVQEFMTKQDLPNALGAQKKWVDSGGTYRKEGQN